MCGEYLTCFVIYAMVSKFLEKKNYNFSDTFFIELTELAQKSSLIQICNFLCAYVLIFKNISEVEFKCSAFFNNSIIIVNFLCLNIRKMDIHFSIYEQIKLYISNGNIQIQLVIQN